VLWQRPVRRGGRQGVRAVGCPPIHTEEARAAWRAFVAATVARYRDRISHYEIWNEPDGQWCWKHGVSATEYGHFAIATAEAIRSAYPEATIIGGAICLWDLFYLDEALATGLYRYLDASASTSTRRARKKCSSASPR
jgi:hypothetical protein